MAADCFDHAGNCCADWCESCQAAIADPNIYTQADLDAAVAKARDEERERCIKWCWHAGTVTRAAIAEAIRTDSVRCSCGKSHSGYDDADCATDTCEDCAIRARKVQP